MFNGNFMTKLRQSNAGHHQTMNGFKGQMPAHGQQYENMNHQMMNNTKGGGGDGNSSFGTTASGTGGGNHRTGTSNGSAARNQAHLFNLVNQRKTPNNINN